MELRHARPAHLCHRDQDGAIWLAIAAIPYVSAAPDFLLQLHKPHHHGASLLMAAAYLLAAVFCWLFPLTLAKGILHHDVQAKGTATPFSYAVAAVAVLGLWKLLDAVPDLLSYLYQVSLYNPGRSLYTSLGT